MKKLFLTTILTLVTLSGAAMAETPVVANDAPVQAKDVAKKPSKKPMPGDTNNDNKVSLDEFLATAKTSFQKQDKNNDGYITPDERRVWKKNKKDNAPSTQNSGHTTSDKKPGLFDRFFN